MAQDKEKFAARKQVIELGGAFAKWGTFAVGGLCLVLYSNEIGHFPEGLDLGEGLAFYLVCAGFFLVYGLYTAICTAMGSVLMALPMRMAHRLGLRKGQAKGTQTGLALLHADFSPMWDFPVVGLGIVGFVLLAFHATRDLTNAALFLVVPVMQGMAVGFLLVVRRRQQHLKTGLLVGGETPQDLEERKANTVIAQRLLTAWIIVAPMLIGPERMFLVDAAFRAAQLRKDNAIIHVKTPWSTRVAASKLTAGKSFLGADYVEFRGVKVLLRSVGDKVVIELPQGTGSAAVKLPVPADSIYVE